MAALLALGWAGPSPKLASGPETCRGQPMALLVRPTPSSFLLATTGGGGAQSQRVRRDAAAAGRGVMASSKLQLPADDSVLLLVTHSNLSTFAADIRVSPQQTTVEALKDKLWRKTGTAIASMRLQLRDDTGAKLADLDDDAAPLAAYSLYNGYQIHVLDLDPSSPTSGGWLEDTSLVDKYEMSDEAYDKLHTNFRKFKQNMAPKTSTSSEDVKQQSENHMEELCSKIKVGDRCEVEPGAKRGTVKFVGKAEALGRGFWVGVQYDEPLGKHDGMVKGIRFFECPQGHGAIVRPEKVKVGDYPERDPFEEEEI